MVYLCSNQGSIQQEFSPILLEEIIEIFKKVNIIQFDTETTGLEPHTEELLLLQLGDGKDQYVIDCTTVNIKPLKSLLEDTSKIIIGHNLKFDLKWLYKEGIFPFNNLYDSFLAERVLSTGITLHKKGLAACLDRYFKIELPKDVRSTISKRTLYHRQTINYAANDVVHLEKLYYKQLELLKEKGLTRALELENLFVPVLAYAEFCGIKLDRQTWYQKSLKDKENLIVLTDKLDALLVSYCLENKLFKFLAPPNLFCKEYTAGINWNSQQQVIPLFKTMGVDTLIIDKKTGKEKDSIESNVLKPQKKKHIIVETYLEYQKAQKLVSTYGLEFLKHINPVTDRIHSNFTQIMNTSRLSSGGSGTVNLQNIPRGKERDCFTVQKGNVFVVSDYSSQESRILAELSKDSKLVDFYLNGGADLHSYAVKIVYPEAKNMTLKEIKDELSDKRQVMKGFNFALAYGGTGRTVSQNLNIPLDIAEAAEAKYFEAFNELKDYFEFKKQETIDNGYVLISKQTGRKSFFYNFDEFLELKSSLEKLFGPDSGQGKPFQGLSANFWQNYRLHKEMDTTFFVELKSILKKYFKLKNSFERKGLNYPIQGLAAEMTKLAGIKLYKYLLDNNLLGKVLICAFVHDEIVLECPKEIAEEIKDVLKKCMEDAGNYFCKTIPIYADPHIGLKWDH